MVATDLFCVTSVATYLLRMTSTVTKIAMTNITVPTAAPIAIKFFIRARLPTQTNQPFQLEIINKKFNKYRLLFCEAITESVVKACACAG